MCKFYVVVVLNKGPLKLHLKEPRDWSFPDFMEQANFMVKPYLSQLWHLQTAKEECVCGKTQ